MIFEKFVFFLCEDLFYLNKHVDPDEKPHYAAFHLGHHCKRTYLGVSRIQRVKSVGTMHK